MIFSQLNYTIVFCILMKKQYMEIVTAGLEANEGSSS